MGGPKCVLFPLGPKGLQDGEAARPSPLYPSIAARILYFSSPVSSDPSPSVSAAASSSSSPNSLSSPVWGNFPEELLLSAVLPKLPAIAQARFRAVSRRWRLALQIPALSAPVCSMLYINSDSNTSLPDYALMEQHHAVTLDLSFLPTPFHSCPTIHAQHGFVCLFALIDKAWRFCVANPITQQYRQLPARRIIPYEEQQQQQEEQEEEGGDGSSDDPEEYFHFEISPLHRSGFQFKLLVASRSFDSQGCGHFYSTKSRKWKKLWGVGSPHPAYRVEYPFPFYILYPHRLNVLFGSLGKYYIYELDSGKRHESCIDDIGDKIGCPVKMLEVCGEVFLVECHDVWFEDCLRVQVLDGYGNFWRIRARMPDPLEGQPMKQVEGRGWEYGIGHCAAVGDALCLTIGYRRAGGGLYRHAHFPKNYIRSSVVLYRPRTETWQLLEYGAGPSRLGDSHTLFKPKPHR